MRPRRSTSLQRGGDVPHTDLAVSPLRATATRDAPTKVHIVAIAAGDEHAAALADDGAVYTFGSNERGQLGYRTGPETAAPSASASASSDDCATHPTGVTALHRRAVEVACGATHTLALLEVMTCHDAPVMWRACRAEGAGPVGPLRVTVVSPSHTPLVLLLEGGTVMFWGSYSNTYSR